MGEGLVLDWRDMRVLAIDTSTLAGGVALVDGERTVAEYVLDIRLTHSERLMPAIDRVMRDAGWTPSDLDRPGRGGRAGLVHRTAHRRERGQGTRAGALPAHRRRADPRRAGRGAARRGPAGVSGDRRPSRRGVRESLPLGRRRHAPGVGLSGPVAGRAGRAARGAGDAGGRGRGRDRLAARPLGPAVAMRAVARHGRAPGAGAPAGGRRRQRRGRWCRSTCVRRRRS